MRNARETLVGLSCPLATIYFPLVWYAFLLISESISIASLHFPLHFLWFSTALPYWSTVFLWFPLFSIGCYGFLRFVIPFHWHLLISHWFLIFVLLHSYGFLCWFSLHVPVYWFRIFSIHSQYLSNGFFRFSTDFIHVSMEFLRISVDAATAHMISNCRPLHLCIHFLIILVVFVTVSTGLLYFPIVSNCFPLISYVFLSVSYDFPLISYTFPLICNSLG